jgi:glycosyltransferase involved in cell wall biosynthesis
VSVALCTYNGGRFIAEQLRSITAQTRPVDEIIVCDDGSTDDTVAEVESAGIAVVRNERRLGVTKNFERAIGLCTGDVIVLCDQDDVWHPEKVATLTDRLAGGGAMAFSNAEVVNGDLSPAGYRLWDSVWFDPAEQDRVRRGDAVPVLLRHAVAAGATLAFRSEYRPLLLPIPDLPHSHDIWITLLLACVGRIEPVDRDLIRYRLHGANTVGLKRHGLWSQIRMARHQVKSDAFLHQALLCEAAIDRLVGRSVPAEVTALLREKVDHSRRRHDLPANRLRRLGVVGAELRRGNYTRYSYGLKSVLQDLFLR